MGRVVRVQTTCGGFVDLPADMVDVDRRVSIELCDSSEVADGVLMRCALLQRLEDSLVYSCGGLLVQTKDRRGKGVENIVVRFNPRDATMDAPWDEDGAS